MNNGSPVYDVLILGAGQIGALFDRPGSANVLSHGHAFSRHPGFHLCGFVDNQFPAAQQAARIWGGQAFKNLAAAWEKEKIDVVVLAIPDEHHFAYLKELANQDIKLVFAEKPLCRTLDEAEELKDLYSNNRIEVAVNYSRRFVPEFVELRNRIAGGEFGSYITGSGYYGKGFLHNGSHMLNLLEFLLGEIEGGKVMRQEDDCYVEDPSLAVVLDIAGQGGFYMQNVDCRCYTVFEMDLLFSKKRLRILDAGFRIEEYGIVDSTTFSGYKNLGAEQQYPAKLGEAMAFAVANIYQFLSEGKPLLCSFVDGYRVVRTCNQIRVSC